MNTNHNTLVYFHTENKLNCLNVYNICSNVGLNMFECQKLDNLFYILSNFKPSYLVVDCDKNIVDYILNKIKTISSKPITFIVSTDLELYEKEIFVVNNYKTLNQLLYNISFLHPNTIFLPKLEQYQCINLIYNELNNLNFRSKLIGYKYIAEVIYNLYTYDRAVNYKCKTLFNVIAKKYKTNIESVERNIRFSITNAYFNTKEKQMFFNISKSSKIPTTKELLNYLLDTIFLKSSEK